MRLRHGRLLGWTLALLAMVLFVALGRWQLGRMDQKQAILDAVAGTLEARAPRPLSLAGDAARAAGYDWAVGRGSFVDVPAVLLDNQQRDGRPGVRAYRLFDPDAGAPLLVELGWLPLPGDRRMPAVALPEGPLQLQGLLAPPPSPGLGQAQLAGAAEAGAVVVTGLDAAALPAALGVPALPPRVLKLDPELALGFARDLDVLPNTLSPQQHLGYAVQWFGLALAVLATALVLTFRRPRR